MENTFLSIPAMVDKLFPIVSPVKGLILSNFWPSDARISAITCPILFISGDQDELIPVWHMTQLHSLATSAKFTTFVRFIQSSVPGGDHNTTWQRNITSYIHTIKTFLDACLRAKI